LGAEIATAVEAAPITKSRLLIDLSCLCSDLRPSSDGARDDGPELPIR
jgi:hypothetical protein